MTNQFITPNFACIPAELRAIDRWVNWNAEGSPSEKPRKVPYSPGRVNARASSTDPTTWGTFQQAAERHLGGGSTGVGFVLDGSGLVGVDIDHCVADGVTDPIALAFLEELGAGYIELSPSGTGLRAFGYAENLQTGAKGKFRGLDVELYSTGRYLTVTGQCIKSEPIGPLNHFSELADRIRADKVVNPQTGESTIAAPDERHAKLVQRILTGEVLHDSLRDLAASLVATGMHDGAVVNHLRALMDASHAPHDARWRARRAQIPALVSSASAKYGLPVDFSALLVSRATKDSPAIGESVTPENRFKLLTADDLRDMPPLRWLVRGVLPAVGLAALFGPSGSGKSFLVLDLATAIAEGRPWYGCRVHATRVLYICLEGEAGLSVRARAWEQRYGRKVPDGVRMLIQPFNLTDLSSVHELAALIPQGTVVFIDTLNRAAPTADENSSKDMGAILEAAKLLESLILGLVVLVHHTGKDSAKGLRGHSSFFARCDAVIEVSRGEDYREWKVSKSKDGADGVSNSFDLEVIELGVDEFGDAITSCVTVQNDSPEPRDKPLTERQSDGLTTFQSAAELVGVLTSAGEFDGLHVEKWRDAFYSQCIAVSTNAKRVAFQRARDDLVKLGRLTVNNDIYRLAGAPSGIQNKLIADAIRKRQASNTPAQ
jgi:AAA domain